MAIVACKECGKDVSDAAERCPHCGIKRVTTGKVVSSIGIGGVALFCLAYCNGGFQSGSATNVPSARQSIAADPCPITKFLVINQRATSDEYGYAKLTGTVRNTCAISAGVELKWTAMNKDGSIAFSDDFFPAHTTNIAPGADYSFETSNHAPKGRWRYTIEPIRVYRW
jgi:DNA-directed RNA polymerase subunit RPC12/RpoP